MAPKLVNMLHQKITYAPPLGPGGVGHQGRIVWRLGLLGHDDISQGQEDALYAAISIDDAVVVPLVPILISEDLD